MPIEFGLWRLSGSTPTRLRSQPLPSEERLEDLIVDDVGIVRPDLLLIGRQVLTSFGGRLDLLGITQGGDLVLLELKRNKTPRDAVAQLLDYASWLSELTYSVSRERTGNAGDEFCVAIEMIDP